MAETEVKLSIAGQVATVTLQTAEGLNVLSGTVLDRIAEVVAKAREAPDVRAFVLAATGKVFIAGANVKELAGLDASGARTIAERGNRAFDAIADLPIPSVARIHGAAMGGGLEAALACDFRIALATAKIGLPETSLGLIPGWKGISRLTALAGPAVAKRLIFSAAAITSDEALKLGIVDDIAEDETELNTKVAELTRQFRRGGPRAIALVKRAIATGDETQAFSDCFAHGESREGIAAFLDKRPAFWMDEKK